MKKNALTILRNNIFEHILFLVLGVMAIYFFEERLLADSGYYIFKVINYESFWVEHNRFILIFSQFIPLIGVKLGFDLKTVLCLYSIGHILFFYAIFLVSRYYYKNLEAGILLLLLQTLGIMSGFFVPMFELYYGAGLLVLFATILYYSKRKSDWIILSILSFFILTGHPYATIIMLFIIVLHSVEYKIKYIKYYLLFIALIIGITIFKKFTASEYEQGKTNAFINNLLDANYDFTYLKLLTNFLIKYYKELLLIELATIAFFVFSKNWLKLLLIILAFVGTLAVINISFYGFEQSRYQEQVYFSLSFIVAYPFVIYLVKNKNQSLKILFSGLAFFIIFIRIIGIWIDGYNFTQRVSEIKSNIEQLTISPNSKFVIEKESLTYKPNWSYPIESMLLSSYGTNKRTITICTDEDYNYNDNKSNILPSQYIFRRWEIFNVETLNNTYFKLDSLDYLLLK